jgi:hypothetical protein
MAKLIARQYLLLNKYPQGSNPDISQNYTRAALAKEWPKHSSPPKKLRKKALYLNSNALLYLQKQ